MMSSARISSVRAMVREVMRFYEAHGRHELPWRKTHDPYAIMVSEIMLQQTQVDRVVPFFMRFMREFPDARSLARASLARVLVAWQGLGYNRRAKMLREAAALIVENHRGDVPQGRPELEALPGIGPYTAGAIRAFAFNEPDVFLETNVRAVLIHHFFPGNKKVTDAQLLPLLTEALTYIDDARSWYSALMDYGTHIKKLHKNPARRSKHYVPQSPFEGSMRQARGAVLRKLAAGPISDAALRRIDAKSVIRIQTAMKSLQAEGLIEKRGKSWRLAGN